jgi:hypothetical protein
VVASTNVEGAGIAGETALEVAGAAFAKQVESALRPPGLSR